MGSIYKIIEIVGTSTEGWEQATRDAVKRASARLRDIRIVEVIKLDAKVEEGDILVFRARLKLSFKFKEDDD